MLQAYWTKQLGSEQLVEYLTAMKSHFLTQYELIWRERRALEDRFLDGPMKQLRAEHSEMRQAVSKK